MLFRPLAAPVIAAVALALAGCTTPLDVEPETTPTPTPTAVGADPVVVETAFGPWGEGGGADYTWLVVLVENPNDVALVSNARVEVDFRGANGSLDTYGETIDLLPGITAVTYISSFVIAADVVALDVAVVVDPESALDGQIFLPYSRAGSFEVTDLAIRPGSGAPGDQAPIISGSVRNDIGRAVEGPRVSVVMRDASGTIIGADTAHVENALGMLEVGTFEGRWFASGIPADEFTLEGYAYLPFTLLGIDVPLPTSP